MMIINIQCLYTKTSWSYTFYLDVLIKLIDIQMQA